MLLRVLLSLCALIWILPPEGVRNRFGYEAAAATATTAGLVSSVAPGVAAAAATGDETSALARGLGRHKHKKHHKHEEEEEEDLGADSTILQSESATVNQNDDIIRIQDTMPVNIEIINVNRDVARNVASSNVRDRSSLYAPPSTTQNHGTLSKTQGGNTLAGAALAYPSGPVQEGYLVPRNAVTMSGTTPQPNAATTRLLDLLAAALQQRYGTTLVRGAGTNQTVAPSPV